MKKMENRKAVFKSSIVFCNSNKNEPELFEGKVVGEIVSKQLNTKSFRGFGFDPIFQPDGNSKLFAEISIYEKNLVSHRAIAFRKFARWYSQTQ